MRKGGFWIVMVGAIIALGSFRYRELSYAANPSAREVMRQLMESIREVRGLKYNLKLAERINGKMHNTESQVKFQRSPRKIYLYLKGPEVLWVQGENNGNALVNPGAFPYINLNLDPMGSLMRKDQHHTLHEMGFDYFADIMQAIIVKSGNNFDKNFVLLSDEKFAGKLCYKMLVQSPDFGFVNYTVKKGENLILIARKLKVGEHMILENNPKVDGYYDVKEGQIIKVPTSYAKSTVVLIDKVTMLPLNFKVSDLKGLYESYEYYNLTLNPTFTKEEFTRHYKDYNF